MIQQNNIFFLVQIIFLLFFQSITFSLLAQNNNSLSGNIYEAETGTPIFGATIFLSEIEKGTSSNENGFYKIENLSANTYLVQVSALAQKDTSFQIILADTSLVLNVYLGTDVTDITTITVTDKKEDNYGIQRLRAVENTAIYASKKNELIQLSKLTVNKATNNSRQIYAKVSGLNIWESDGAGIQLGIGGRGLSPSRNANFNTRQNGYDISADALGYPESYYTPPVEAIQQIEIVRGAASLQYGTQFGGMLNFRFKEGSAERKLGVETRQSIGSFGLFSSYNSVGGTVGKVNYYGFYQYKHSDGWRPNSSLNQHTAYVSAEINISDQFSIRPEYTHTNYLAQQPGGLTDTQFNTDPRQSNRGRNWFAVDWNLFALHLNYQPREKIRLSSQFFGLIGGRDAVGNLGNITQIDFNKNRDLLTDDFKNIGNETRVLYQYTTFGQPSSLLVGARYYQGLTLRKQGEANADSSASFVYLNPAALEGSDFDLPSKNISLFAENVFNLSEKWSVTPGFRYEWIKTAADGYYTLINRDLAGNILIQEEIPETKSSKRQFVFFGIGSSYKWTAQQELYVNFSQNYRAINFNDIRVSVGNLVVDENLKDERGFNADIGARGRIGKVLDYDVSIFYLNYQDRIGSVFKREPNPEFNGLVDRIIRFRTNVADARIFGWESVLEWQILKTLRPENGEMDLSIFTNFAYTHARYFRSEEPGINGKEVELVPPVTFKTGLNFRYKKLKLAYQYSYTAQHFSDATNAILTPNAIEGIIPAYVVMDVSGSYEWKQFRLEAGINNLTDRAYFTRRATGYPGPGIIPSTGRAWYVSVGWKLW